MGDIDTWDVFHPQFCTESERRNTMKELVPLLDKLAEKLGITVQYIFSVFVRQAFWSGISDLIQYTLLIIGIGVWWKYREKFWSLNDKKSSSDYREDDVIPKVIWTICGVVLFIILIVVFFCFPNTIKAFVNPECWALERILDFLRGVR